MKNIFLSLLFLFNFSFAVTVTDFNHDVGLDGNSSVPYPQNGSAPSPYTVGDIVQFSNGYYYKITGIIADSYKGVGKSTGQNYWFRLGGLRVQNSYEDGNSGTSSFYIDGVNSNNDTYDYFNYIDYQLDKTNLTCDDNYNAMPTNTPNTFSCDRETYPLICPDGGIPLTVDNVATCDRSCEDINMLSTLQDNDNDISTPMVTVCVPKLDCIAESERCISHCGGIENISFHTCNDSKTYCDCKPNPNDELINYIENNTNDINYSDSPNPQMVDNAINNEQLKNQQLQSDQLSTQNNLLSDMLDSINNKNDIQQSNLKLDSISNDISSVNSKLDNTNSKIDTTNSKLDDISSKQDLTNANLDAIYDSNVEINNTLSDILGNDDSNIDFTSVYDNFNSFYTVLTDSLSSIDTNVNNLLTLVNGGFTDYQITKTSNTTTCNTFTFMEHSITLDLYSSLLPLSPFFSILLQILFFIVTIKIYFYSFSRINLGG